MEEKWKNKKKNNAKFHGHYVRQHTHSAQTNKKILFWVQLLQAEGDFIKFGLLNLKMLFLFNNILVKKNSHFSFQKLDPRHFYTF